MTSSSPRPSIRTAQTLLLCFLTWYRPPADCPASMSKFCGKRVPMSFDYGHNTGVILGSETLCYRCLQNGILCTPLNRPAPREQELRGRGRHATPYPFAVGVTISQESTCNSRCECVAPSVRVNSAPRLYDTLGTRRNCWYTWRIISDTAEFLRGRLLVLKGVVCIEAFE